MAEGKKIEIKIAATGGDQAAAEIGKVQAAKEGAEKITGFGGQLDGVPERAEEVKKSFEEIRDAAEKAHAETAGMAEELEKPTNDAAKGSSELDENVSKIARTQKAMVLVDLAEQVGAIGEKFQEAAKSVKAFDPALAATLENTGKTVEKVSSGVSAIALGFAAGGVIGGAVTGLGVLVKTELEAMGEAAAETGKKVAEAAEHFQKINDQKQARFAAAAVAKNDKWLDALDNELDAIQRTNDALQRSIDLIQAKRRAQLEVEDAKAAFEMAGIDANDNLTDAQKIQARAKIQAELEKKKFDARRLDAIDDADKSDLTAKGARQEAQKGEVDATSVFERLQKQEAEKDALEKKIFQADQAKAQLNAAGAELGKIRDALKYDVGETRSDEEILGSAGGKTKEKVKALQSQIAKLEAEQRGPAAATPEDRGKLDVLRGKLNPETNLYDMDGAMVDSEKLWKAKEAEAAAKRAKADDAEAKAAEDKAAARDRIEKDREATTYRLRELSLTSNSGAKKADEKDKEETDKKVAAAARKQLQGQIERDKEKLKTTAVENESRIENSAIMAGQRNPKGKKALKDLAKDIGDADSTAEINAVKDAVKAKSGELGAAVVGALTAMISKQEAQIKQVNGLTERIRRLEGK